MKKCAITTLSKNINATLLFLLPFFISWTQRIKTFSIYTKEPFLSNSVLVGTSLARVCLRLATIKGHSKMFSFITQHNATDVANFEGVRIWHA